MKLFRGYFTPISVIMLILLSLTSYSQNSDELFQEARSTAFDKKNYPLAIQITKQALTISPDYKDIRIFLGRLYTWSDRPDSARIEFQKVLKLEPGHEDASLAYGSLEYWNDQPVKALDILNAALDIHPEASDLLLLKARILNSIKNYREAQQAVNHLLKIDPKNAEARAMAERISDQSSKNKIGISYDFIYFDKQFNDPWHLASFDYGRQTAIGSITARVNYANRFKSNGTQFEIDAYPKLSPTFYTYISAGYSKDVGVFPNYRAGFSLYANLPSSFEADAGVRFLRFSDNTFIYTLAVGKYYSNYWFNFRTYLTPSIADISQSYNLTIRYYLGGTDDYLKIGGGTGISPDESSTNILLNQPYKLKSNNVSLGYSKSFKTFNVISVDLAWLNQEYRKSTFGNQSTGSISYKRRF